MHQISNYIYLKMLACQYFLKLGESSLVWTAMEEADSLIDYLDIYLELSQYWQGEDEPDGDWLQNKREEALSRFHEAIEVMESLLNKNHQLDPVLTKYIQQARGYLKCKVSINALLPSERFERLFHLKPLFDENFISLEKPTLDTLLREAEEEMQKKFAIPFEQLHCLLPMLSFCDRTLLQNQGIFRINQEYRHLVFPKRRTIPASAFNTVYQTHKLDNYLYLRDLRLNLLRKWGRSIPLKQNHLLIKFYNEPSYWDGRHIFPAEMDYLRLGFAYFQYAMELGKDSEFTRMNYRNALNCFSKSKLYLPQGLRERLWGI